jgi:hypothetical protein
MPLSRFISIMDFDFTDSWIYFYLEREVARIIFADVW